MQKSSAIRQREIYLRLESSIKKEVNSFSIPFSVFLPPKKEQRREVMAISLRLLSACVCLISGTLADIYMHNPRGSNNR